MALDKAEGRRKGRATPKGRQLDDVALSQVRALLGDRPRKRDLLIEFLHLMLYYQRPYLLKDKSSTKLLSIF